MKKTNKILSIIVIIAMIFNVFLSLTVLANSGSNLSVGFSDGTINGNTITYKVGEINVDVNIDNSYSLTNGVLTIDNNDLLKALKIGKDFNSETMAIRIYSEDGFQTFLVLNQDGSLSREGEGGYPDKFNFVIEEKKKEDDDNPNGEPDNQQFDGKAYYVWEYNGKVCYHKFTDLKGRVGDNYEINYFNVSEIVDESGNNGTYEFGQENANWVLATDFEDKDGNVKNLSLKEVFGDGKDDHGITLDPCGAKSGKNSISTNGDRNFRATIYKNDYEAITFGASIDDYKYFPAFWDGVFYSSTVDISGTTKSNPAIYETYLLEPTISFNVGENSKSNIKSVKALDVNENAVTVTNKGNGQYLIRFNSNYYDKVIFEVTTEDGNSYYVMIGRIVLKVFDNFGPNMTSPELTAELYYPTTYNYDDFQVIVTVYNEDGTTKTTITNLGKIVDEVGNITNKYKENGGKDLSFSQYRISVDENVVGAYFTVVNKGALDGDSYGGTFSGSGKGAYYDVEARKIIYK